jgi:hypothetical protein
VSINDEPHCICKVENFRLPGDAFGHHPTLREEIRGEGFGPLYEAPSILSRVPSEHHALELFPLSSSRFLLSGSDGRSIAGGRPVADLGATTPATGARARGGGPPRSVDNSADIRRIQPIMAKAVGNWLCDLHLLEVPRPCVGVVHPSAATGHGISSKKVGKRG